MRPLHRPKHAGSRGSWNGTIRRSMAVGSIWPNVNSLCSPSSVWIAVFLISPCCVTKLLPGKQHVITTKRRSTGAFIRRMPASHSNDSIRRPLVRDGCLRGSVLGFYHLSSFRCSDLGCWVYYENTLPRPPRSEH